VNTTGRGSGREVSTSEREVSISGGEASITAKASGRGVNTTGRGSGREVSTSHSRPKKRKKTPLLITLLLLASLFALASCQAAPPVVKIGLVAPFEGRYRPVGYDLIYSARLAIREINAAGGIDGVHVALVALDDGGDPRQARAAAATLIRDPDVVAVLGHWRSASTAAAVPLYAAAGLPLVMADGKNPPLAPIPPDLLPASFRRAYVDITPFEEAAGPYAGPAYDGMNLLFAALQNAADTGTISRESTSRALETARIDGLVSPVSIRGDN
jgi:ABC-type branched-subunit amino acid transport system substrate-binding protein